MTGMNPELVTTLDDAVAEVLASLTGLDLQYLPTSDRYSVIARALNKALRLNAAEHEWSFYASTQDVGPAIEGEQEIWLDDTVRVRQVGDDSVRLVDDDNKVARWAYMLPRDALFKYGNRAGLWCSITRNNLTFSRPFNYYEGQCRIHVPVMREPVMFRLPVQSEDPADDIIDVPVEIRLQPIDFSYPDIITMRAAFLYAQTDPVMQPRVQTLEAQYKDLMYQVIERDDRNTDSPYLNEFFVPVQNGLRTEIMTHGHPHSDERRR